MQRARLIIGNRTYSSWSLRGWLMARHAGLEVEEDEILLGRPDTRERILEHSPSGRVPCLVHDGLVVWDTLAIGEYLAERFPDAGLWPDDGTARAHARAVSAEMHAGFMTLRQRMPMNARKLLPGKGRAGPQADLLERDIARIAAIWREARARFGAAAGDDRGFLYGRYTVADAMFAPVVLRFRTYAVVPDGAAAAAYMDAALADPHLRQWIAASEREAAVIPDKEL